MERFGLVGLPNAGKSSLYNALTGGGALAAPYAFATKDPSLLLNGVAGMVFGYTPGMTNSSMLRSLSSQLSCISKQIAQLQNTLNNLKLDTVLSSLKSCTAAVNSAWSTYQQYIANAGNNPNNPAYALSTSNRSEEHTSELQSH